MDKEAFASGFRCAMEKTSALYDPRVHKSPALRKRLMKLFGGETKNLARQAEKAGAMFDRSSIKQLFKKLISPKTSAAQRAEIASALKTGPFAGAGGTVYLPKEIDTYGKKAKKLIGIDPYKNKELAKMFPEYHESLEILSKPMYLGKERAAWLVPRGKYKFEETVSPTARRLYKKLPKSFRDSFNAEMNKRIPQATGQHLSPEVLIHESNMASRLPPKERNLLKEVRKRSGEYQVLKKFNISYGDEYVPVDGRKMNSVMKNMKKALGVT